jgi:gas vesicle protein
VKFVNHKGHEDPRRKANLVFLRGPSCPLWLIALVFSYFPVSDAQFMAERGWRGCVWNNAAGKPASNPTPVFYVGGNQPKWMAIAFGISSILNWTLWMIRPRVWDYNEPGALKRLTSLGAEKRGIMTTGRYDSSESSHMGTAITFLLIGLGAGALAGLLLAPKAGKQLRKDLRRGYEDAKDSLEDWADEAKDRVREVGERVRDAASRGADLAEDLREKVEPLRRAINRG